MDREKAMSDMIRKMNGYDGVSIGDDTKVPKKIPDKIKKIIEDNLDYFVTDDVLDEKDILWLGQLMDLYEKSVKVFDKNEVSGTGYISVMESIKSTPWQPYNDPFKVTSKVDDIIYK